MARVLSFLKRYFSNYYTLYRSDLAARAAPLDPRLQLSQISRLIVDIYIVPIPYTRNAIIRIGGGQGLNRKAVWDFEEKNSNQSLESRK